MSTGRTRRRTRSWVAALLLFASSDPLAAQAPVEPGTRVRIEQRVSPHQITGVLAGADSLALRLQPDYQAGTVLVRWADLEELAVSRGYRGPGASALRGGRIGMFVGLGASAALIGAGLVADSSTDCGDCMITATGMALLAALPITAITTIIGLIIGSGTAGEQWQEVPVRR